MYITFLDKNGGGGGTSGVVVTTKTVNVSSNPQTITANTGYAWSAVTINSDNVFSSGYTSGYTDASALIPVITGESYTYSEDDDFVKTISAQTGTAFSAVTVDATNKFVSGYKSAGYDVNEYSKELTVSANGIYNADIQYEVRGYYKKVTVDIPSGGPSYGVFADMTGVGFIEDDFTTGTTIEMDLAIPSLAAYLSGETGETILHIANYNTGGNGLNCEYSIGEARPNGYQRLEATCTSGGTLYTLELGLNKEEGLNTRVKMRIRRGVASYPRNISYFLERIMDTNTDGAYAVGGYAEGLPSSYNDTLYMFSYGEIIENLPHYLKEYKKYHNSTGTSGGDVLVQHIVARSDGKMWDLISNQEANIDWIKYDGTHPTTFNIISDYDI